MQNNYYFTPIIINDLFSKVSFLSKELVYIGEDQKIQSKINDLNSRMLAKDWGTITILASPNDQDIEQKLVKLLSNTPYNTYVCSLQKMNFLESKRRYNELFRKKPQKILIYSHRIEQFKDQEHKQKVNSNTGYCWIVWYRDENGFFSKTTELDWIY